ncbi:hypothetical protein AMAG_02593 [Allomyces macrogynus ATCC 38327]|uniref:DUF707 domain-containing protein n=1 Tax=Allomyces macrogynus (strain ATCC 38327) TaxID=578462 RepID=A0A0L0S353_ALLM3|nr:hypothetical protein AMAG_02593 [Allomyces macrogynus ATCC 38327]|eukprot:KNE56819.1 hypothetical protein AMAG_02593 [Allomyces macrogynus ATCC 38327]
MLPTRIKGSSSSSSIDDGMVLPRPATASPPGPATDGLVPPANDVKYHHGTPSPLMRLANPPRRQWFAPLTRHFSPRVWMALGLVLLVILLRSGSSDDGVSLDPMRDVWPLAPADSDTRIVPGAATVRQNVLHYRSRVDATYGFLDREPGNLERMTIGGWAPRSHPLDRKLGLIAIPAGNKAKPMVDKLVRRFGLDQFAFMIFHWDNATWYEYDWYRHVTAVRALGQTKYWFAKRYLTPDVVQVYDYIWLWDDDIELDASFDPVDFTRILKDFNVHFAQPSLLHGEHGLQGNVVHKRKGSDIGRFTSFVEVMIPIVSRGAWPCAWRLIPWDARATWGVDNVWYPVCGAYGYCRFAVIDAHPVKHMDTRTFDNGFEINLAELGAYTNPFNQLCADTEQEPDSHVGLPLRVFCRWWTMRDNVLAFDTVRKMTWADKDKPNTCPDQIDFPGVQNVPWWHVR